MIYTDEDKVDMDGKTHFQPHLKPDFNIDLLRSNNYITHFLAVKRSLLERVVASALILTGRRIMILFSAVQNRRKQSVISQGYCITGDVIKSRLLRILSQNNMRLMRESVRSESI